LPAVVVVQEWWGLDDHIKDVTRRVASAGFVALAPDLYHGRVASEPDEARKLVMEFDMAEAVKEIGRAAAYLLEQPFVAGDAIGIMGFCMGGGLALQSAAAGGAVAAVVAFYGRPLGPDDAGKVKAPVLGLYGEKDTGIAVADVEAMKDNLTAAGVNAEVHVYPGAGHAFFNDRHDTYNAEAAADAWRRTIDWFKHNLAG
jgi:carboxymethylenebutenolidase